jgi:adenylate cyclase class 2
MRDCVGLHRIIWYRASFDADGLFTMAGPIETEVKIPFQPGADAARALIESQGYRMKTPRRLQVDQIYDFSDRSLRSSGRLLRLRSQGGQGILTFKGPVDRSSAHKSREELETAVEDRGTLELILDRLGFVPAFRYEKYRTTFDAADEPGLVELDETPIGVFMELEGPSYWIDRAAARLGFTSDAYVLASYASLYQHFLKEYGGPPDMVFV